jgi:hypothetical protein
MTALPDLEPCVQCDHKRGEHTSTAGGSFNLHPVHYGHCRVTGCDCGEYQPKPTSDQSESAREALQRDLLTVFERYGVNVAVGLTRHGVAIRSQDERVDAANVGAVRARLASDEDCHERPGS